jgi:hypothetical protein
MKFVIKLKNKNLCKYKSDRNDESDRSSKDINYERDTYLFHSQQRVEQV